jgi:hypothetical protein
MFWLQMDSRLLPELLEERMMIVVSVADGGKKSWSVRLSYICQLHVGYILDDITLYIYCIILMLHVVGGNCCICYMYIIFICVYNIYI